MNLVAPFLAGRLAGDCQPAHLRDELLFELFATSAARTPGRIALVFGNRRLSYGELAIEVNRVAQALRARGIGRGAFVGLWMERSLDLHIALLGILAAGAAYIPFDADAPAERVAVCLDDCLAAAILVDETTGRRAGNLPAPALTLTDVSGAACDPIDLRAEGAGPADPAYAIYTSGSTGLPKAVVISHRNICHYLRAANDIYGLVAEDVVFQGASVAFDLSLEEIFLPYLNGATLWVAGREVLQAADRLADILDAAGITVLDTVPTLLTLLPRDVPSLRVVILGGEACPPAVAERWCRPGRRLFNTYGPTETTVVATVAELAAGEEVTIGRPVANMTCYVVDEQMNLVGPGTEGELLIGGPGVAAGYLGRPELTEQKFIANPFAEGGTDPLLYRSGDAVSLDERGRLRFHGRIDDQVKIRGFRVELGEIEAKLSALPGIAQPAVVLREDGGVDRLVAFIVPTAGAPVDVAALRAALATQLPCYMIPSCFEVVTALPRLSSGKVDRKTLRKVELSAPPPAAEAQEEPATATEAALLAAAQRVFPGQAIPLAADFFLELGGHSLLAARFVSAVRETPAYVALTMQDVYAARSLRAMAALLDGREAGPERDLSFAPPPLLRRFLCGLAQAAVLPVILALANAPWLGVFISYVLLAGEDANFFTVVATLLATYSAINLANALIAIAVKWAVLGRTRPGRYKLWGAYYFRWWMAQRFLGLIHLKWLQDSPAMAVYLRLLGAKVGRDALIGEVESGAFDLLEIGAGATVASRVHLATAEVTGDELVIGPITIGRGVGIGNSAVIGPDSVIGEGAEIDDLTAIAHNSSIGPWERWTGSPGRPAGRVAEEGQLAPATASRRRRLANGIIVALALVLLPSVSLIPVFPAFALFDRLSELVGSTLGLGDLQLLPLVAWPAAMVMIAVTVLLIAAFRWLLLPRVKPGVYSVHSFFYQRKWLVAFLTELTLDTLSSLYATVYMRAWYRLMGAKIGKDAEISTNLAGRYDLIEIGDKSFIADEVVLGDEVIRHGWVTLEPVRTGKQVFVGNVAVVPPGTVIPDGVLIGVSSMTPSNEEMAGGGIWFGSPPIKLPVRQQFGAAANWTFEPPRWRRIARAVFEAFAVSLPTMLFITFGTLAVEELAPAILAGAYDDAAWQLVGASLAISLGLTLSAALVKWVMMGVYRPAMKPMWSWWALRTEAVAVLYWGTAGKNLLDHLRGTPFLPWVLRLFGTKMGEGVYMDSTDITEFDCVNVGSFAVVNSGSALQTHLYEDRVMKVGRVEVGRGVTVGTSAAVLYDTRVGDYARLGPLTIVMKGEEVPAHTSWQGAPAQPAAADASPVAAAQCAWRLQPAGGAIARVGAMHEPTA